MGASMTETSDRTEVAIIGAGIIGIAVAYFLVVRHGMRRVVLLDAGDPMALTSAQSGENYRNWWPHPLMTAFTDDSIGLMEDIARASGNRIRMTRRLCAGDAPRRRYGPAEGPVQGLRRRRRAADPGARGARLRRLPARRVGRLGNGAGRRGRAARPRPDPRKLPELRP
jgi:glycine/D-amino acid oxidase-like deaminating enzyme